MQYNNAVMELVHTVNQRTKEPPRISA